MSGEDVAKKVMNLEKKRECLVDYAEGVVIAKTLYLDERMMEEFLRDIIIEDPSNKLIIDTNGNIVEPKPIEEDVAEIANESPKAEAVKNNTNSKKPPRFKNFINNNGSKKGGNKN